MTRHPFATLAVALLLAVPSVAHADEAPAAAAPGSARAYFTAAGVLAGLGLTGAGVAVPLALVGAKGHEPATFAAVTTASLGGVLLAASIPLWVRGAEARKAAPAVAVTPQAGGATVTLTARW